jgi:dienelactone hydrolase
MWLPNLDIELSPSGSLPTDMVRIKGGRAFGWLARLDPFLGATLDDYFMDRYEVTNRKFKEFVDAGGYRDQKYWKHQFVDNERSLSWEEVMEVFCDSTGRSGPATWELGTYPEGKGDYPVGGVSWYEAAAYAEFAGKSLPTVFHWVHAAGIWNSSEITPLSHFGTSGPSPVGNSAGMGLFSTYDMAGNVREWCWNDSGKGRYILGGAWDDRAYMFRNAMVRPPFDRQEQNGFRCVRYRGEKGPSIEASRTLTLSTRDYRKEQPVNDDVYQILRDNFNYDPTPLNAVVEAVDDTPEHWRREKISFDCAYDNERMQAYLFLPRSSRSPFQTVVYYPATSATMSDSFDSTLGKRERSMIDFLIRDGRALVYPILKATHERSEGLESTWPNPSYRYAEYLTCWVKDIRRTIDYLETRQDIDIERLAYFGFSWGARYGAIIPAIDDRLKVSVLVSGGLVPANAHPEVDQINYVTRVTIPTLMINGRYDTTHPYETAQKTMLDLLGTPSEHKRLVNYDGGHIPPRNSMIRETLDWLDRYLGPVQPKADTESQMPGSDH